MPKIKEPEREQVNQSILISEGWTQTLIKKYLPEPILKTNPRYKSAAPMKLWYRDEVNKITQTTKFKQDLRKTQKRRESTKKAVNTKTQQLKNTMTEFLETIRVKIINADTLEQQTIDDKQDWYDYQACMRGHFEPRIACDADEKTILRWKVNYIRHNLISYDKGLAKMHGKTGIRTEYPEYKKAVLNKIAAAHPYLKEECDRQSKKNRANTKLATLK